ncbi:phage tail protein, partial [Cedecea sp.]|uniref:phage tail protein n=1 Tax=Cedecea sp. TaxID=1970739 RepID=UPI002F3FE915
MSQTAITIAFEQWKAQQGAENVDVVLDEFVFANVPGLDPEKPVDRQETIPVASIVHRQAVSKTGVVNENAVVYSVVLGAEVGDFDFNWIGLVNKASGILAMVVHAPVQKKVATAAGQQGNVLTRSFLMEYSGAATETQINTPAETWQIDFTARLAAMDERQRMENVDIYGAGAFFGDGWRVVRNGNQYSVQKGAGYVGGLRAELAVTQPITVGVKPAKIWLDVCWKGTLTSVWGVQHKLVAAEALQDYQSEGVQHYVFALASIDASGVVTDLRPKGTLGDQQGNSDFVRKDQNLADLNDAAAARKNIGLGDIATHDAKEFVSATGGDVGWLDNANHYATKEGAWPGGGAFQSQLADRRALFYSAGYSASGNVYLPMTKATVQTAGTGYQVAISYGVLVSGKNDFPSGCIHILDDQGRDHIWTFNPNDNSFTANGSIRAGASVYAGGAIFEPGGNINGEIWGGWLSTWLANQFTARDNNINTRATWDWANGQLAARDDN